MAHHLSIVPNQSVDMETQLSRAEGELAQQEAMVGAERERLFAKAMELSARGVMVPDLSVDSIRERALAARKAAVDTRAWAIEEMRRLIKASAAQMAAIANQVAMQEQAAAQREQASREQAAREQLAREQAARAVPAPTGREQRRAPRVKMQAAIDFSSDTNFYSGFSTNISEGGVFIATVKFLPHGTPVELAFSLPNGQKVSAQGVVRWTREINDKTPDIFPGIGVQFTELTPEATKAIHQFVKAREPLFFPD